MQTLPGSKNFPASYPKPHTELLFEASSQIPGSVHYSIRRYARPKNWMADDIEVVQYNYEPSRRNQNFLELKFCSIGNMYCRSNQQECSQCRAQAWFHCEQKAESVDFLSFVFSAGLLEQFINPENTDTSFGENVLSFQHNASFIKTVSLCNRTRMVVESLLNHNYSGNLANIFVNAQAQLLLLYSIEALEEKEADAGSKFLTNESDREKIIKAREVLLQHIGEPITIKALSRKVAMNECYLKKGFKQMFGTTIFDFYQSQRMEHAKYLLYEKGLTVTEVSILLGYSSISHFSTAFKKHTGLKPCELLR